ncbi:MAG TPA: hypothetical protein VF789_12555 [Thermoanaerobaculia bacterium]
MPRAIFSLLSLAILAVTSFGCSAITNKIDQMTGVSEARRLQETGEPATARILEIWDTGMTVNDDPVIGLRVEVSRADGSVYTTTIAKSLVSRVHIPQFQPGETVAVRIDPQNSANVALDVYQYR